MGSYRFLKSDFLKVKLRAVIILEKEDQVSLTNLNCYFYPEEFTKLWLLDMQCSLRNELNWNYLLWAVFGGGGGYSLTDHLVCFRSVLVICFYFPVCLFVLSIKK